MSTAPIIIDNGMINFFIGDNPFFHFFYYTSRMAIKQSRLCLKRVRVFKKNVLNGKIQ